MNAFFCRTPIHVFRAVNLIFDVFMENDADIFIFDTFPYSEIIADKLLKLKLFTNVYYIHDKDYLKIGRADGLRTTIYSSQFKDILVKKKYDEIYLFNIYGAFNDLIFNVLIKNNKNMRVNMIEDGPSIYHIEAYGEGLIKKFVYPIVNMKSYLHHIDIWWFSEPELMETLNGGIKNQLPKIDKKNRDFINKINYIFSYEENNLIENADIIIMEECYWTDGLLKNNEDFFLFKTLVEKMNNSKTVIKLHPRTKINRFTDGFKVVPANGIPWEVYALNMNMNKKILVSLSCATMISTKLLYGEETYSLLLYPILEDAIINKQNGEKYLTFERKEKIDSQKNLYVDKNKFFKAKTIDEANIVLNNWIRSIEG